MLLFEGADDARRDELEAETDADKEAQFLVLLRDVLPFDQVLDDFLHRLVKALLEVAVPTDQPVQDLGVLFQHRRLVRRAEDVVRQVRDVVLQRIAPRRYILN